MKNTENSAKGTQQTEQIESIQVPSDQIPQDAERVMAGDPSMGLPFFIAFLAALSFRNPK